MIPEPEHMQKALARWEAILATRGWDNTPAALTVAGYDGKVNAVAMTAFPVQPGDVGPDAGEALKVINESLDSEAGAKLIKDMHERLGEGPKITGLVFAAEVWGIEARSPEERGTRAIADTPGAYEARYVIGVDCGARVYWCQRKRGQEPVSEWAALGDDKAAIGGPLVVDLARLLKLIMQFEPAESIDRPSMNALIRSPRP